MRELWAPGLSRRDGTRRLEAVIEAHAPSRDFSAELLRASVATMLLNGPAPYRFELGSELGAPFVPEAVVPDRPLKTIQRENDAVAPWAALLRRIRAEDKRDPGAAEPLFITVEPNDPERLRVALVETSSRFEEGNSKRVELLELEDDGRGTFVVPRFAADVGETTSIDIVAVNSSPRAYRRLRWSYAFGGPPTLDRVRIEVGGETVYDASWTSPELPDDILSFNAYLDLARRELDIGRNSLAEAVEPGAGTLDDLVVELEFSKPVRLDDVTLGEFSFQLDGANELATEHTLRETSVDLSDASGELQLTVDASDEGGLRFDAAPSSPAALADDGEGWRAYEADGPSEQRAGGVDRNHVMHLGLGVTYLAEFRLRVDEAVVYDAHWNDRSNTRTLDVVTDEAIDPSGALGSGDVELVFNRPVDLPEVRLGEEPVEVVALADGRRFFGTIDAAMLRRLVGAGGGFRVSA